MNTNVMNYTHLFALLHSIRSHRSICGAVLIHAKYVAIDSSCFPDTIIPADIVVQVGNRKPIPDFYHPIEKVKIPNVTEIDSNLAVLKVSALT